MRDIEEMLTLDERSSADFILTLREQWDAAIAKRSANDKK